MADEQPSTPEGEILLQLVQRWHGASLTPDTLEEVRKAIEGTRQLAAELRSAPLQNSDEPLTRFTPYRQED